jgi:hypothetical protein
VVGVIRAVAVSAKASNEGAKDVVSCESSKSVVKVSVLGPMGPASLRIDVVDGIGDEQVGKVFEHFDTKPVWAGRQFVGD